MIRITKDEHKPGWSVVAAGTAAVQDSLAAVGGARAADIGIRKRYTETAEVAGLRSCFVAAEKVDRAEAVRIEAEETAAAAKMAEATHTCFAATDAVATAEAPSMVVEAMRWV